jgi:hypothetical protein
MNLELYIEIDEQGNPVNHPLLAENLHANYPDEIPAKYQPFTRVPKPDNYTGDINDFPTYQKIDGIWQDFWVNP